MKLHVRSPFHQERDSEKGVTGEQYVLFALIWQKNAVGHIGTSGRVDSRCTLFDACSLTHSQNSYPIRSETSSYAQKTQPIRFTRYDSQILHKKNSRYGIFFYYVSSNFGWLADFFFSCVGLSRVCIAFEKGATKACNEIEARKCSLEQKKSKRQKSFFLIFFSLSLSIVDRK